MNTLIFCPDCNHTILANENSCPYCHSSRQKLGSRALALSILMGFSSISCIEDEVIVETPEPETTIQADDSQKPPENPKETKEEVQTPETQETKKTVEVSKLTIGSNDAQRLSDAMKNKPAPPMAAAYGSPAMDMNTVPTHWSMSSIKIALKDQQDKSKIKREIQKLLQRCDVSSFPEGKSYRIALMLEDGKIETVGLKATGLNPVQQECINTAFTKKRLPTSFTGEVAFTIRAKN